MKHFNFNRCIRYLLNIVISILQIILLIITTILGPYFTFNYREHFVSWYHMFVYYWYMWDGAHYMDDKHIYNRLHEIIHTFKWNVHA